MYLPGSGVRSDTSTTSVWAFPRPVQEAACAFRKSNVQKEIRGAKVKSATRCNSYSSRALGRYAET